MDSSATSIIQLSDHMIGSTWAMNQFACRTWLGLEKLTYLDLDASMTHILMLSTFDVMDTFSTHVLSMDIESQFDLVEVLYEKQPTTIFSHRQERLSLVLVTSPVPSNPSTELLEHVLKSFLVAAEGWWSCLSCVANEVLPLDATYLWKTHQYTMFSECFNP